MYFKIYLWILIGNLKFISSDYLRQFGMRHRLDGSAGFLRFLQTYKEFYLIIHVDNVTKEIVNDFLKKHNIITTIYNHDLENVGKMSRPGTIRCLNLAIFTNPFKFSRYLKNHHNLQSNDVLMFATTNRTFDIIANNHDLLPNLSKIGRVVIVKFEIPSALLYTMCFYCGKLSGKLSLIRDVEYRKFLKNPVLLSPYDFSNLNGHILKVVYIDYFPYIFCKKKKNGTDNICERAIGAEFKLLDILSHYFNFEYELIEAPNNSYNAIIMGLVAGDYDFAIGGISVTNVRREILQFSTIMRFEELAFLFIYKREFRMVIKNIGLFLNPKLMLVICIPLSIISLIVHLLIKYATEKRHVTLKIIRQVFMRAVLEQSAKLKYILPKKMLTSIYIVLSSWYLFVIIINVIYKSELNALMVRSPPAPTNLRDILKDGYHFAVDISKLQSYDFFFVEDEERLLLTNPVTIKKRSLCELALYIEDHKAIIAGEINRNLYHTRILCSEEYKKIPQTKSDYISVKTFAITPHAWAFQTGVPFVDTFSRRIKQVMSGGLLKIWKERALVFEKVVEYNPRKRNVRNVSIHYETFLLQFVIYLGLMSFCLLVFFTEIGCHSYKKYQNKKNSV